MASCGPYIYGQISALSLLLVRHQYHQFPPVDSPALIVNCSLSMLTISLTSRCQGKSISYKNGISLFISLLHSTIFRQVEFMADELCMAQSSESCSTLNSILYCI